MDRRRVTGTRAAGRFDLRNHFVYQLKPETDGEGATALFVACWEDYTPISAVVAVPDLTAANCASSTCARLS